ncbi:ABC transporter ATP-binding protein, partial [Rhodobacteraceae bacterium 4F10]
HVVVIRNGVKLYSGRVDEMTASNGFFELQADNQETLKQLLENHSAIGNIKEENGVLIASLASELSASEINTFLFNKGVSLSHLVKRKPSLEQQFLDLTNNQ